MKRWGGQGVKGLKRDVEARGTGSGRKWEGQGEEAELPEPGRSQVEGKGRQGLGARRAPSK